MSLGTEVDLGPGHVVLDGDPAPPNKGHSTPTFLPISIVAKRSPISATAEHLYSKCMHFVAVQSRLTPSYCLYSRFFIRTPDSGANT